MDVGTLNEQQQSETNTTVIPVPDATVLPKRKKIVKEKKILPLFGPEGLETAKLLKDFIPISDRWLTTDNYDDVATSTKKKLAHLQISTTMACATCGITFDGREEQTEHFKTDWHRFNIKQRLKGATSVTELTFTEVADDISSLSGTDYTDSSSEDEQVEDFTKCIPSLPKIADAVQEELHSTDDEGEAVILALRNTQIYMKTSVGQVISIYRAVLFNKKEHPEDINAVRSRIEKLADNGVWIVMMMGGGHFAAAVFDKYVVRAKCGSSQSQHDKKGKHAQSAGAQIRRHNEAALKQDIADLMESWSSHINNCQRIFLKVGTHNYSYIFTKKEKYLLDKHDQRIRMIPFPTKRATFSEVKRIYAELSCVKIIDSSISKMSGVIERKKEALKCKRGPSVERRRRQGDPEESCDRDTESDASPEVELSFHEHTVDTSSVLQEHGHYIPIREEVKQKRSVERKHRSKTNRLPTSNDPKSRAKPDIPAEHKLLPFQSEFYTACMLGDKDQLEGLVESHREEISHCADDFSKAISLPVNGEGSTLLHIACQHAQVHLVSHLLSIGCNPSISNDRNIVPYMMTQNKSVRNEFRIFMHDFPETYDYSKAQVPGPLTKEMAAEKDAKESEKRRELNRKKKERLKVKRAETAVQRAEEEEQKRFLSLSDREKRALAAEKRLLERAHTSGNTQVVLNRCYNCAADITGKIPFEYSNNTFCSPGCLKAHRLGLKNS